MVVKCTTNSLVKKLKKKTKTKQTNTNYVELYVLYVHCRVFCIKLVAWTLE